MQLTSGQIFHVFNRTNRGLPGFIRDDNYRLFLAKTRRHILPHATLLAYCVMPTHFHFLMVPGEDVPSLSRGIAVTLRSYTRALQKQENFRGSLFQQGTRAVPAHAHAEACFHYIHQNPVAAGLSRSPGDWRHSSYHEYAGRPSLTLCDVVTGRSLLDLPVDPAAFRQRSLQMLDAWRLRAAINYLPDVFA